MIEAQPAAAQESVRDLPVERPLARVIEGTGVPLRFPSSLVHFEEALQVSVKLLLAAGSQQPHLEIFRQFIGAVADRCPELGGQGVQVGFIVARERDGRARVPFPVNPIGRASAEESNQQICGRMVFPESPEVGQGPFSFHDARQRGQKLLLGSLAREDSQVFRADPLVCQE